MANTSHENTTAKQQNKAEESQNGVSNGGGGKDAKNGTQTGQGGAASSTRKETTTINYEELRGTEDRGTKKKKNKTEKELEKNKKRKGEKGDMIKEEKKDKEYLEKSGLLTLGGPQTGKELEEGGKEALEDKAKINKCKIVLVVLVVLAVPIISAVIFQRSYHSEDLKTPLESVRVFDDSFVQFQASFPQQTPRFWRILRNRATAHLKNPNPKKPLVFMLTAGPSAHDVLDCIARKLAQSLDYEYNGIGDVNSGDYRQYSSLDEAKEKLDKTLDEMLQKGRTVLIFNVDRLPVQSPLLFYQYCDNENAPYKRAAIVFTVRLPAEPDPSLEPAKEEGLVAKYLRETWGKQDYRPDDIPPLVSRMTDTVAMVKQERNDTVERNCDT